MIPLWHAVLLLQQAGYSDLSYFPASARHPTLLIVKGYGQIPVTDDRVAVSAVRAVPTRPRSS